ncbi:MAG: aspartate kinase, partial [Nanoarchaeota archaeon]|nr:aspartate kinase [Nanoarchaeota archaeon]
MVIKFGGTSVGNADRIKNTAGIIKSYAEKKPVVVVSAVGGITDKLIELANAANQGNKILDDIKKIHYEILEKLSLDKNLLDKDIEELTTTINEIKNNSEINDKILDKMQSFGEQMSSKIVVAQLNKIGVKAQAFNAWDLGFLTDSNFGSAEPLEETFSNLNDNIKTLENQRFSVPQKSKGFFREFDVVPVVTGFLGKTKEGEITTLGRGGSDYTAAIIGNAIDADEIQIWTDVDGMMSADPKMVSNAKTLNKVSFAEASELAYFGARVLHPKTILPAMKKDIPVRVLNSLNPENNGTTILNKTVVDEQVVKA